MENVIWKLVSVFMPISIVLCLLLCISNKKYKYYWAYIVGTAAIIILEFKATNLANRGIYNVWLYNYESVIEYGTHIWLVSRFVYIKKVKFFLTAFVLIYTIFGLYRSISIPNDYTLDNFIYYSGNCFLIIASTYYFFELLLYPTDLSLMKMPSFWFCTGVLIFNSFTFSYLGISELLIQIPKKVLNKLELAKTLAYLLTYILFCIAFICQIKIKKLLPSLL